MAFLDQLDLYEKGIYDAMVRDHGIEPSKSVEVLQRYYDVMRALVLRPLGRYENAEHYAPIFIRADRENISADLWLKRIRENDRLCQQPRRRSILASVGMIKIDGELVDVKEVREAVRRYVIERDLESNRDDDQV